MNIEFLSLQGGRRLYAVREYGEELFVGTRDECDRFLEIHNQKVLQEQQDDGRHRRNQAYDVRVYRMSSKLHA